ncbi:Uncharacterised protein [Staphylococcus aureus]|uniref:Uncharacterized protein n=1 Tax=Staphylococcus aureus TaxID=1280 RepID=A0A380DMP6_STAAU|nr:Uncharacterised protein [Staphylococcus aureus]
MYKNIGVLGGNGTLGQCLTQLLSKQKDIKIKVAFRSNDFLKVTSDNVNYEKN